MSVSQPTIKADILASINANGQANGKDAPQSIDKFADDLATIIKNAITSGSVSILPTELTAKVVSSAPGSPVVCAQNLTGTIS